jgi:hypothetical protein
MDHRDEELRQCKLEIQRLLEENAALRWSSESFAALAQRLSDRLRYDHGQPAGAPRGLLSTRSDRHAKYSE